MTWAAGERPCIEMGSRRTHEWAAVALRPGGVRRRVHRHLQPPRPPASTASRPPAPARTRSRCCTTPRPTRSARRCSRSARAPRCWSTPTTSPRRSASGSRSPGPSSAPSGSTPATSGVLAYRVRAQLDELGATKTRIIVTSDLDEFAIAGLSAAPVDGYGVGTAAGHRQRPPDLRLRLQAGRPRGLHRRAGRRGQEEQGQDLGRGPQVRPAPALPRRHGAGRGDRRRAAGRERRRRPVAAGAARPRRRGGRARAAGGVARAAPAGPGPSCRWWRASSPRATPCIETSFEGY